MIGDSDKPGYGGDKPDYDEGGKPGAGDAGGGKDDFGGKPGYDEDSGADYGGKGEAGGGKPGYADDDAGQGGGKQ